jgi:hypothetical protein
LIQAKEEGENEREKKDLQMKSKSQKKDRRLYKKDKYKIIKLDCKVDKRDYFDN